MALVLNYRRNVLLLLFALLLLGAFGASGDQWIGWAFVLGILAVILLIDFMFGACGGGHRARAQLRASTFNARSAQPVTGGRPVTPRLHYLRIPAAGDGGDFVYEPDIRVYARRQAGVAQ